MKTPFFILFLLLSAGSFAQDIIGISKSFDFRIIPAMTNNSQRLTSGYSMVSPLEAFNNNYSQSKIYEPDGSVYLLAQSGSKKSKVIYFAPDLTVKWETAIEGVGFALGNFNGNILLVHGPMLNLKNYKDYHYSASLLNKQTGKVQLTKTIHNYTDEFGSEAKFFIDPNGKWFLVGSRKTNIRLKITWSKFDEKYDASQSFTITKMDEKLESGQKYTLTGNFLNNGFVGSGVNAQGDVFICSYEQDKISVEKFTAKNNYDKPQVVSRNLEMRKNSEVAPLFYVEPVKDNEIFLSLRFENSEKDVEHNFIRFDFDRKKAFVFTEIYNKAGKADYELTSIQELNKDLRKPSFKIWDLEPSQVLRWNNKTILLKESNEVGSTAGSKDFPGETFYTSTDLVIQVFNDDNKLLKQFLVPKYFHPDNYLGLKSGAFVKDNILYTVSADSKNAVVGGKTTTLVAKFDLNKLVPLSAYWIKKGKDMSDNWSATESGATLLFKDGFAISNLTPLVKGLFKAEAETQFQKVGY